ncbi:glycosyltransferase family 4 protein [Neorhizobium alkalisoli]|uniref:Glycosyltransferase involved in cell wall biosynthesis n=1 Tax=Neorhizobium alkalisoli TaxID=528178 RepID=A0A561R6N0_9HYPH|nr:glycosyltransferase family 4 protein [Neorhizobium alkalisoli]TWF58264.1 glycosyltransferase involved in cell wall biosynthesis [Neorhizobium alkalisoli]
MNARVLFVSHTGSMSGAEYVLANLTRGWKNGAALIFEQGPLAEALKTNGLDVETVQTGESLRTIRRGGSLLGVFSLIGPLLSLIGQIVKRSKRCDVIYANSQKAFLLSALASFVTRKPLIWHLHDILDGQHFGANQRRLQVFLANRRASLVLVPSKAAADAFVASGGKADLVKVVPNGVPSPTASVDGVVYRAEQSLPSGQLIGVFSRLAAWKGQHVVLEALAELPQVSCIIVGSALFDEQDYERRLHRIVEDLDLGKRVRFLGQRSDVANLMRAVDIVVHPSVDPEPFGLTVVEAMLAGTPVIATDAGACAEILENGNAGRLVRPGSVDDMARAIREVFAADGASTQSTDYARQRAERLYGLEEMRSRVLALVGELVMKRGVAPS